MEKKGMLCLCVIFLLAVSLPVFAESINFSAPVLGSWVLSQVYENASGAGRFALEPEEAGSLYMEAENIYSFYANGAGITVGDSAGMINYHGFWEADGDFYTMTCNDTDENMENGETSETVPDSSLKMEWTYDADEDVLHRFWKDDAPDALYHDLDFVYVRVPAGAWQMKQVYSAEPGTDPVLMDPENAASLYAESGSTYFLDKFWNATEQVPADGGLSYVSYPGTWAKEGDRFMVSTDGVEMDLFYDTQENVMHRYLDNDDPEATYHHLDFVYYRVPAGSWKMMQVVSTDAEGKSIILDPENSASLYAESVNLNSILYDGSFQITLPDGYVENGTWTLEDGELVMTFDTGDTMTFTYDDRADVLHRYYSDDSTDTADLSLDFVYIRD